jgi:uncharacterized protein (TIGR03437 family)
MKQSGLLFSCLGAFLTVISCFPAGAQTVRFRTNLGDIDVTLLPDSAPLTVQNFLKYVGRGSYANSFFHRSVTAPTPFIIQGGGYQYINNQPVEIPADPPVRNEYRVSNTRGTLAMAKLGSDPNSATTQWFFNLANNAGNLNNQNGGFTVFGRVADDASLAIMDRIAAVPVYNAGSPFDQLPLQNYRGGTVTAANLVLVTAISILEANPAISDNGVISASNFGAFASAAAGSYIEIYGSNLAKTTRMWAQGDFTEGRAPTGLDDVAVTVDGKQAFVYSVSPTQVNVQVPAGVANGAVPVVVTYGGRASAPVMLPIKPVVAGLLAPAAFKVGDKQYVAATHHANGVFVNNGMIPNVPAEPAVPGETLVFYGIGFGPITAGDVAGRIASGVSEVVTPVQFQFGDIPAQVLYAGLVPGLVGLYQFNVVVPAAVPGGDLPLKVTSGGEAIGQTLFISVRTAAN